MKKMYEVWGIAMVPNEVVIHVEAESEADAMKEAERVFYAKGSNPQQYVQSCSADKASVEQFVASEATLVEDE